MDRPSARVESRAPPLAQPRSLPLPALPKTQPAKVEIAVSDRIEPQKAIPRQPAPSRLPSSRPSVPRPAPSSKDISQPPREKKSEKPQQQAKKLVITHRHPVQDEANTPHEKPSSQQNIKQPAAAAVEVPAVVDDDTPRAAHLRWLEEHPELAFGGGSKIANFSEAEEVGMMLFSLNNY